MRTLEFRWPPLAILGLDLLESFLQSTKFSEAVNAGADKVEM